MMPFWLTSIVIGISVLLAGSSPSKAHEVRVDGVAVVERGIFHGHSEAVPMTDSPLGSVAKVRGIRLLRSTTTIPARKALRFGLRYILLGQPDGSGLDIRLVTRFPPTGLFDPATGVRHHESAYTVRGTIGAPAYREFAFDQQWEIVEGEWVFEFWHGDRLIGRQRFCVVNAETAGRTAAGDDCSALIGEGIRTPLHALNTPSG